MNLVKVGTKQLEPQLNLEIKVSIVDSIKIMAIILTNVGTWKRKESSWPVKGSFKRSYNEKIIRDNPMKIAETEKKNQVLVKLKPPLEKYKRSLGIMTGGSFKSFRKAYVSEINIAHHHFPSSKVPKREDPDIIFSKKDTKGIKQPHGNPLVIMLRTKEYNIHWILIKNRSLANILYISASQQMKISERQLRPITSPLISFTGYKIYPKGIVTLTIIVGTYLAQKSKDIEKILTTTWQETLDG